MTEKPGNPSFWRLVRTRNFGLLWGAIGLSPISYAASGALMKVSLRWVFIASGGLMALFSIVIGLRREIREMGESEGRND